MGILDNLKKTAADALKKTATDALKKATSAKSTEELVKKAASLVGSKTASGMSNTPANTAAQAKAAKLVGSKAAQTANQQYAGQPYVGQPYTVPPAGQIPAWVAENIEARVRAKGIRSNWRVSIVDLMTALDMDSSLTARKKLAARLNYSGYDADGSAEKNMWLHAELIRILTANGGQIPWNLFQAEVDNDGWQ